MQKKQHLVLYLLVLFFPLFAFARTANDPFVEQWSYEDVGVYNAWDLTVGSRAVVVAIIDNGFDYLHPDLRANSWKNEAEIANNNIDDDDNGYIDDVWGWNFIGKDMDGSGEIDEWEEKGNNNPRPDVTKLTEMQINEGIIHHGTLVAGIIGGVGNNQLDGAGVNWQVRLMNLKIVDKSGRGDLDALAKAIRYAVDNGADIINVSMVGSASSASLAEAVNYAYESGVSIIAAAGNGNIHLDYSPMYPICADALLDTKQVLGVSAIQENHRIASFSNNGATCIDITAPGVNASSTQRFAPKHNLPDRYGGGWNGTSFAAPLVSGAAALIKSIQPEWGPAEIYHALLSTTHHTPGQDETVYAQLFGAGLLQIDKALEYAMGQPRLTKQASKIMSISKEGFVNTFDVNNQSSELAFLRALGQVDSVVDGETFFVTNKLLKDKNVKIFIYDRNWKLTGSWQTYAGGPVEIGVADVLSAPGKEIVIAPRYADNQVFRVFDQTGGELGQYRLSGKHSGVSIDFIEREDGRDWIVAMYSDGQALQITEFNSNLALIKKSAIDFPAVPNNLKVGDIDGDGSAEYVVSSRQGEVPYIGYYEIDGSRLELFAPYDSNYRSGYDIGIIDGDLDGSQDVAVVPRSSDQSSVIWSGRATKIHEWNSFDTLVQGVKLLVY